MPFFPVHGDIAFGVNGKTVGNTTILTVPTGGARFVPVTLIVVGSLLQLVGSTPTVSLGTNSATFDNIIPATALTITSGANKIEPIQVPTGAVVVAANDEALVFRVSVAATGTNYIMHVAVLGYELI